MKLSISQHMQAAENWRITMEKTQQLIDCNQRNLNIQLERYQFFMSQINEAIRQKKDGFDEDKFLVKRK